jgi:hypothetical protein
VDAPAPISSILEAVLSEKGFARFFHPPESWLPWFTAWQTLYGIELTNEELDLFKQCTGRQRPRPGGYTEAFFVCGRRSGKSKTAALVTVYEALFGRWETRVSPGERFFFFVVATDRSQAGIIFSYVRAMLEPFRDRKKKQKDGGDNLVERETFDEIWLRNGAVIAIKTAAYRALRGFTVAQAVLDEMAFLRDERSANPAEEIVASLLPALLPGGRLLGISTPYAKFGLLWELFHEHYGVEDSDQLIWRAPTRVMNPAYLQSTIDRLLKRDRVLYTSEYMAEFRDDVGEFIPEALVNTYCTASPAGPEPGRRYVAFCDPSGGRSDSFTLGIAHVRDGRVHLDFLRERESPFVPSEVVTEYAGILHHYGIPEVVADKYAGAWVEDSFKKHNIRVVPSEVSASDLYAELQPRLSSGQVILLNDERLKLQLRQLERRAQPGGRDRIDHPQLQGFHDDCANACAGAVVYAVKSMRGTMTDAEMDAAAAGLAKTVHGSGHGADKYLSPSLKAARRLKEIEMECSEIMDEYMREGGGSKIIRP